MRRDREVSGRACMSIKSDGELLIRVTMRYIRNEEVLIDRSESAVELISNDGQIGEDCFI